MPEVAGEQITPVVVSLSAPGGDITATVVGTRAHSLLVVFDPRQSVPSEAQFERASIRLGDRSVDLGRGRFVPHAQEPRRRRDDPPPPKGDGQLVFTDVVYDFSRVLRWGSFVPLSQKVKQLPLMWSRKSVVDPRFRELTGDIVYDLQVYRSLLDEIDRGLEGEPQAVREVVRKTAMQEEYAHFCELFDARLHSLESMVSGYSHEAHEKHGYYFRKHVWDLILSSEFLARTNLKPRGYAGDSEMMRMLYEDEYRGATIFARFMHKHPTQAAAAQAVRNRIQLIGNRIRTRLRSSPSALRVMSVACGPARELRHAFESPEQAAAVDLMLLDQDPLALAEARAEVDGVSQRFGVPLRARYVRDSVRTMLKTPNLQDQWGQFDLLYSMGLFDYLTPPTARAVLARLYEVLAPGGEMVIGNFHVGNKTRIYMEYWMDWALYYRNEEEFTDLAVGLPNAQVSLSFEDTRSQVFLHVSKPA